MIYFSDIVYHWTRSLLDRGHLAECWETAIRGHWPPLEESTKFFRLPDTSSFRYIFTRRSIHNRLFVRFASSFSLTPVHCGKWTNIRTSVCIILKVVMKKKLMKFVCSKISTLMTYLNFYSDTPLIKQLTLSVTLPFVKQSG